MGTARMPGREEYRRKAEITIAQAELLRDPQERTALLVIAKTYLKLAARIGERHDRATAHPDEGDRHPENDS
jgi:hypothetical protein